MEERPFRACPEPVEGAALRVTEEKASGPVAHLPALGLSGSTQALQRRTMPPINLAPRVPNPCRRHPERSRPSGEARDLPRIDTGRARPSSRLIREGSEIARARSSGRARVPLVPLRPAAELTTLAGVIPSGAVLQAKRGISRASTQEGQGLARG
jgi:hypothetical protein